MDQDATSIRLAAEMFGPDGDEDDIRDFADVLKKRMVKRPSFAVGSNPTTAPFLERSFALAVSQLEAHLKTRRYLFGNRPCLADFGLAAQFYQVWY